MFAVQGWNLASTTPKTQIDAFEAKKTVLTGEPNNEPTASSPKSKKRKRGNDASKNTKNQNVILDNLSELWATVIEKDTKSVRTPDDGKSSPAVGDKGDHAVDAPRLTLKEKKRAKKAATATDNADANLAGTPEAEGGLSMSEPAAEAISKPSQDGHPGSEDEARKQYKIERAKAKFERRRAVQASKAEARDQTLQDGTPSNPGTAATESSQGGSKSALPVKNVKKEHTSDSKSPITALANTKLPNGAQSSVKLTPLQQKMAQKLTSARFRYLNESLYTSTSSAAKNMFATTPGAYASYHEGFQAQVKDWPSNPVDDFIAEVQRRASLKLSRDGKRPKDGKKAKKQAGSDTQDWKTIREDMLPRDRDTQMCRIIDLGCGDAKLALALHGSGDIKHKSLQIRSFDLVASNKYVTVADITNLHSVAVDNDSVDMAICCLSLMGTNWIDVVDECSRVVRDRGEVWIAEIKSRFKRTGKPKHQLGIHRDQQIPTNGSGPKPPKGNKSRKPKSSGGANDKAEEDEDAIFEDEVDEVALQRARSNKDETDVSDFIEVWKRRGFTLRRPPDLDNKMFVKMFFVKDARSLAANNGQSGHEANGNSSSIRGGIRGPQSGGRGSRQGDSRFSSEREKSATPLDEAQVLKPCVYKTR